MHCVLLVILEILVIRAIIAFVSIVCKGLVRHKIALYYYRHRPIFIVSY